MKKSKFSIAQKAKILAEHDGGESVADLCRQYQISAATLYKWKKDYEDNPLSKLGIFNKTKINGE